ncbi:hypothetical protein CLU81_2456 [Flavobacterium sp. 9]|uniref:hypothetical protein n=1 Tax=Flavobacterium sp. 9 TaxID=2035198 RepID=UPI000C19856B|nr:hypothetical protein [Flavobacterium sp. 9]PIF31945.1 hypothetical protein CLU81_2456 [Flavobacterium sp. 9]
MKKSLYLFIAALLVFVSCTNDYDSSCVKKNDSNPVKNDTISPPKTDTIPVVIVEPILLKKQGHTYANGNETTLELSYNGNKIVSDKDVSNVTNYTYTGDLITKIEKADISGNVYLTKEYFYANGKLDYVFSNEFGNYYLTKYVYNSDGSVFYHRVNSDSLKNDKGETSITGKYVFSKGNLIAEYFYNGAFESVITYEYDSKNNPRVNVLGSDLLADNNLGFGVKNNVIKRTSKNNNPDNVVETITYTYEYDVNGYPTNRTEVKQVGVQITTETSTYSY